MNFQIYIWLLLEIILNSPLLLPFVQSMLDGTFLTMHVEMNIHIHFSRHAVITSTINTVIYNQG